MRAPEISLLSCKGAKESTAEITAERAKEEEKEDEEEEAMAPISIDGIEEEMLR